MIKKSKPIILVQGFGWTGSGALVDYLRENTKIKFTNNGEIQFVKSLINIIEKIKTKGEIDIENGIDEIYFTGRVPFNINKEISLKLERRIDQFFSNVNIDKFKYQEFTLKLLNNLEESLKYEDEKKDNLFKDIFNKYWCFLNNIFDEDGKIGRASCRERV